MERSEANFTTTISQDFALVNLILTKRDARAKTAKRGANQFQSRTLIRVYTVSHLRGPL